MSRIAEVTGIGRATLYKYFPDVEAILSAWHQREVGGHLAQLEKARDEEGDPRRRPEAVLTAYARITHQSRGHHEAEMAALLHRDEHVARAEHQVLAIFRDLLSEASELGTVRTDASADELARYCLHALAAASGLPSKAAVERLVMVTLAGLHPDPEGPVDGLDRLG
jgi:AcrR family transcriptional regulator